MCIRDRIKGYTDGTFRPEQYITRAEAMTMINRVLCRIPEKESDLLDGMIVWPDNNPGDWHYVRRLKRIGVGVYFEKENVNTLFMDNEMILTFFFSQAQAESESLSGNVKWGHRKNFKDGKVYYNYQNFLGYRKGADGQPEVDEAEAAVVRRIFSRYLIAVSYTHLDVYKRQDQDAVIRQNKQLFRRFSRPAVAVAGDLFKGELRKQIVEMLTVPPAITQVQNHPGSGLLHGLDHVGEISVRIR